MNDEIKEILYYYQKGIDRYEKNMKNYTEYQQKTTFSKYHQRYKNHKLLLDYITNLQTIEQQYSAILSENAELENKITNLQEENERLKKYYNEEYDIHLKDKTYYFNLFEDYKSRNEKAIEYMYETLECNYHGANITFDELIHNTEDILKGDNK